MPAFPPKCLKGHELTEELCIFVDSKYRKCRVCHNIQAAAYQKRKIQEGLPLERTRRRSAAEGYRHYNLKSSWLMKLGGKCAQCAYGQSVEALQFDHKNRAEKQYEISKLFQSSRTDLLESELKKCQILCANCHSEKSRLEKLLETESVKPEELQRGDLIQVIWMDVVEDPVGDPDAAKLAYRTSYGLFWAWKDSLVGKSRTLVTSNTVDDPHIMSQSGWIAYPEGMILSIKLVKKQAAKKRKQNEEQL